MVDFAPMMSCSAENRDFCVGPHGQPITFSGGSLLDSEAVRSAPGSVRGHPLQVSGGSVLASSASAAGAYAAFSHMGTGLYPPHSADGNPVTFSGGSVMDSGAPFTAYGAPGSAQGHPVTLSGGSVIESGGMRSAPGSVRGHPLQMSGESVMASGATAGGYVPHLLRVWLFHDRV